MPHLVLSYSSELEQDTDFTQLCRDLADTLLAQRNEHGQRLFPVGGIRVFAYPAAHAAIADGQGHYGFLYAHLRIAEGRSSHTHKTVGDALLAILQHHFKTAQQARPIGLTVQIDEGSAQVYDGKLSSLHPLFSAM